MNKFKWIGIFIIICACIQGTSYAAGTPSEVESIQNEIEKVRIEAETAKQKSLDATHQIESLTVEQDTFLTELDALDLQIQKTTEQIAQTEKLIEETTTKVMKSQEELQQVNEVLSERTKMMDSRVVHMYINGNIPYIDVILGSDGITDFLSRVDAMNAVVQTDKKTIEETQATKELLEIRKLLVEAELQNVNEMRNETAILKTSLFIQQESKQMEIRTIENELDDLKDVTAEQEQQLMELAKKEEQLQNEKLRIENKKEDIYYTNSKLNYPLPQVYRISSLFGPRTHPVTGKKGKMHTGVDFAAPGGESILAAEAGRVIVAGPNGGYGNTVILNHGDGLWTLYAHMKPNSIAVVLGETVKRGQKVGEVGTTGVSTGNHLHFEVRVNAKAVNPLPYLR